MSVLAHPAQALQPTELAPPAPLDFSIPNQTTSGRVSLLSHLAQFSGAHKQPALCQAMAAVGQVLLHSPRCLTPSRGLKVTVAQGVLRLLLPGPQPSLWKETWGAQDLSGHPAVGGSCQEERNEFMWLLQSLDPTG